MRTQSSPNLTQSSPTPHLILPQVQDRLEVQVVAYEVPIDNIAFVAAYLFILFSTVLAPFLLFFNVLGIYDRTV